MKKVDEINEDVDGDGDKGVDRNRDMDKSC